jgi:predicted nucleotidyltransferase component of viral defense system
MPWRRVDILRLRDNPDDLAALIAQASAARSIPQAFVEKDFWVTEVLRSVAEPLDALVQPGVEVAPHVVFKGGTSLSRAYHLIQRFSEDIDLLVAPGSLAPGSNALDRLLERIDKRARPSILEEGVQARVSSGKKGLYRNVQYDYPTRQTSSVLRPYVYLEMGIRGRAAPTEQRSIRSLLAEIAIDKLHIDDPIAEFTPFTMEVLGPERTLIEKCAALHSAAARLAEDPDALRLLGRHLYDVHAMLASDAVLSRLQAVEGGAAALGADCYELSQLHGWSSTPRPDGGYASSSDFVTGTPANEALRAAYRLVGPLVYGDVPTFEECIQVIQEHAAAL